jgi:hypothetical protein
MIALRPASCTDAACRVSLCVSLSFIKGSDMRKETRQAASVQVANGSAMIKYYSLLGLEIIYML